MVQNETLLRPDQGSILFAGTGEDGKIAGQASLAVAMVMPEVVNPREAFSLVYGTGTDLDPFDSLWILLSSILLATLLLVAAVHLRRKLKLSK